MEAQHSKAGLGDHGLNRIDDAIVMWLHGASDSASGSISQAGLAKNVQLPCPTPHG
jgi:hypothetical protein